MYIKLILTLLLSFQIETNVAYNISKVTIQGSGINNDHVTSYNFLSSFDGQTWKVTQNRPGEIKVM